MLAWELALAVGIPATLEGLGVQSVGGDWTRERHSSPCPTVWPSCPEGGQMARPE